MDHKFKSKWESNNFDQKTDYGYQGFSWPQRNFMCNFCNKEYKSAQALGGHMNVHRRDRARLRLSSPNSLDHHLHPNPNPNPNSNIPNTNPNPNYVSPPSPVRYLPYKAYHSSLFPPVPTNIEYEQQKLSLFACSGRDFLGCMRKSMTMEDGEEKEEENGVWKKYETFNKEMEMGFLKDGEIELDLELRLGRS